MNERLSSSPDKSDRPRTDAPAGNGRPDGPSSGAAILLIDDNPEVARAMRIAFGVAGHRLEVAAGPEEAWSRLASGHYDAILLDLNFTLGKTSGDEGLACLMRIMADDPAACVVVITAHSGIRIAVAAMQAGARDFVMKPWRNSELLAKVEAAIGRGDRRAHDPQAGATQAGAPILLGDSPVIAHIRELIRRVGPTMAGIAVTGPSGAGRTLVAHVLHAASAASRHSPVMVDLRDPDLWSRLDGAKGTVVLRHPDRLDELAQARLLARLPAAMRPIAIVDDLTRLTSALRNRIATVEIAVPPLRARERDAMLLARHFLRLAAERHGLSVPRMTPAAERVVLDSLWPDEVRGLALAIERAVLLGGGGDIDGAAIAPIMAAAPNTASASSAFDLAECEKAVIAAALREHRHNITQAAVALGLSRGALYRRMERYGL